MKCRSCNAIIPDDIDICPACFSQIQTTPEPLVPPPPAAPRANPRPVEIRSEASRKTQEGGSRTPLLENATTGNSRGRFSRQVPKKGLFLVTGILAVIILVLAGYMVLGNRQAPVPPPVAKEQPAPASETQAPEKPAEVKPTPPVHQEKEKKTAKASTPKTPAAPAPKAWTYRPDPQPKPASKPQAQRNGIGVWLDRTLGPEKPVTQPSNDPRYTGQ